MPSSNGPRALRAGMYWNLDELKVLMRNGEPYPQVGFGYRAAIGDWTREHLDRFDVLEITVDHCIYGGKPQRSAIFDLVGRLPLTAHGVGLSIGTDEPLDLTYLDEVAAVVERLEAPAYSEHLAFTRVPGRDLANLLPLPKTEAVAESIIAKVRTVRSRVPVPFLLENITYMFEWPDSKLSDAEFLTLICGETGAGLLLDIENVYLNATNHGFDPYAFLDALPAGIVKEVHMAGGITVNDDSLARPLLADSHSHPVPDAALDLLAHVLARQTPGAIILERDDRLDAAGEILDDVARIRACVARAFSGKVDTDLGFTRDRRSMQPKSATADLGGFPQENATTREQFGKVHGKAAAGSAD